MANVQAKVISLALAGACALGAWKLGSAVFSSEDEAAGARHLINQVWIERIPDNDRDMITHLLLLDTDDGRFGAVGRSSAWRHVVEIFKWSLEEDRLALFFPQERTRSQFKARTWECGGEAPEPFDLCLELSRGDRSVRFFSHHEWVVRPHEGAVDEAALREIFAGTPALLPFAGAFIEADAARAAQASEDGAAEVEAEDFVFGGE